MPQSLQSEESGPDCNPSKYIILPPKNNGARPERGGERRRNRKFRNTLTNWRRLSDKYPWIPSETARLPRKTEAWLDEQNAVMRQYAVDLHHSNLLHKTTVDSTVLPIITAIMYKVMYRVGFGNQRVEPRTGKNHRSILLSNLDLFARFGFHSREEMEAFANSVSTENS